MHSHVHMTRTHAVILCPGLTFPDNGTVVISSTVLGVGTTASYTCNQGTVLVGDVIRTCEDNGGATLGEWTGTNPSCEHNRMYEETN